MNNQLYEINYTKIVEPQYGEKRDLNNDYILEEEIEMFHNYSIENRINMTQYDTYSIDPIGCKDADDAFSIYKKNNKLFLAIHIADPTEYIPIYSELWKDILNRTTTKYPSNREPIHMMPHKVLELSSLQSKTENTIKKAITINTEINMETYEPINDIKILFTNILLKKENALSYNEAAKNSNKIVVIETGLKISEALKKIRAKTTKGIKLNELSMAYPIYDKENDNVFLYEDSTNEKLVKQMIAEFAIFANSFVGEYLKIHLNTGIFRTCNAKEWLNDIYNNISGKDLLKEIITNGIKADYMSSVSSHDLVGMPEYCHFTSPIRRVSDCVCHYLLKYIYLKNSDPNKEMPFNEKELEKIANCCLVTTRNDKKKQYTDIKFRLLQVMHNMLLYKKSINIGYYVTSYTGLFLNIIISKIDDYNVHMSYTLRINKNDNCIDFNSIDSKIMKNINITHVKCFEKYDMGTIPELDNEILHKS